MGKSSGGTPTTTYTASPEQRQLMKMGMPALQNVINAVTGGNTLWNIPEVGQYPSTTVPEMPNVPNMTLPSMSSVPAFNLPSVPQEPAMPNVPTYSLPNVPSVGSTGAGSVGIPNMPNAPTWVPEAVLPTTGWYEGLAPEVKTSLYEPYNQAADYLTERLGAQGQFGSPRAGASGTAGVALGELYGQAANDVGLQAWQMTAPGLTQYRQDLMVPQWADYNAALTRQGQGFQAGLQGQALNAQMAMQTQALQNQANMLGYGTTANMLANLQNQGWQSGLIGQNQAYQSGLLGYGNAVNAANTMQGQQYQTGMTGQQQAYDTATMLQNQLYNQGLTQQGQQYQAGLLGQQQGYDTATMLQNQLLSSLQAPYQILPTLYGGMSPYLPTGVTTQGGKK